MLKIPAVGEFVRNTGKLIKIETIQPPPPKPYIDYIFEDITARCELRLNGEIVKELGTLGDFYGEGASVKEAIKEMQNYASERKLGNDSELEVVVIKIISQCRKRQLDRENFWVKGYAEFDYKEHGSSFNLPTPTETIVWSSKNQDLTNPQ